MMYTRVQKRRRGKNQYFTKHLTVLVDGLWIMDWGGEINRVRYRENVTEYKRNIVPFLAQNYNPQQLTLNLFCQQFVYFNHQ